MFLMLLTDESGKPARRRGRPIVPFEIGLAAMILVLCLLYGLVFGYMIYVSLVEQVLSPHEHQPLYAGRPHFHSPAEWVLLVFPAIIAWSGTISSLRYLGRRWLGR
jgi:hypothetical protein